MANLQSAAIGTDTLPSRAFLSGVRSTGLTENLSGPSGRAMTILSSRPHQLQIKKAKMRSLTLSATIQGLKAMMAASIGISTLLQRHYETGNLFV